MPVSKTGHIPTPEGGAMDVYVDGDRAQFRDGYRDGAQVTHRDENGVLSVFITGKERLGITNVSGEFWADEDDAFQVDGQQVEFEHERTDDEGVLRFETEGEHEYTVEIRSVGDTTESDEATETTIFEVCMCCGQLKPVDLFEPGDDVCTDCYNDDTSLSHARYEVRDDGRFERRGDAGE